MPDLPPPPASPLALDRRTLLKGGLAGGLLGAAGTLYGAVGSGGFTHGVASGEPGPHRVLLWTRYAAAGDTRLHWEIARDESFVHVVAGGSVTASPARDCCAKAWAGGLTPGQTYYYRFVAPGGARSPVGRTKTLPVGGIAAYKMAVFSCSNLGFGWFNAYAHAAQQGDFDLVCHLGDYYYEYPRGEYPSLKEALAGRMTPLDEAITLAGYRERFAAYRSDTDLQRLHQLYPWIAMWDDHETANDTWKNGAENHQPNEGDFAVRKAVSERVYREWMPVSDAYYGAYEIGNLATLFKLESRHLARDKQLDLLGAAKGLAPEQADAALTAFRNGVWRDSHRTLLGAKQEAWLAGALKASVRARKPWQVVAQEVVMGPLMLADAVAAAVPAKAPAALRDRIATYVRAGHDGLPFNMDSWDGYPAARDRFYQSALAADANVVVLSGDSHNAWAFDLDRGGTRVGVEMAGQGVTSPGAEAYLGWVKPDELARTTVARNPQLKWCDTARRGYMAVELTQASATCEWRFMDTIRQRSTALSGTQRMTVLAGQRQYTA